MLPKYLVPFSLIAHLSTSMFCLDKQPTILITVSIKTPAFNLGLFTLLSYTVKKLLFDKDDKIEV